MRRYTSSLSSLLNLGGNTFNAYLSRQFYYQNTPTNNSGLGGEIYRGRKGHKRSRMHSQLPCITTGLASQTLLDPPVISSKALGWWLSKEHSSQEWKYGHLLRTSIFYNLSNLSFSFIICINLWQCEYCFQLGKRYEYVRLGLFSSISTTLSFFCLLLDLN